MGALIAVCPQTGQTFETGIETDQTSMALTPEFSAQIECPHCGARHAMSKDTILVCEFVDGIVCYQSAA